MIWPWICAAAVGAVAGASELLSRYRSASLSAVMNGAAAVYLAINALASLAAFALTRLFGWDFGFNGSPQAREWVQCLVAGFGAMVLFRSSLFTVRAGDREIGFGPARVLQVLLETADREVKLSLASQKIKRSAILMAGVSFADVYRSLPVYCLTVVGDVPDAEQQALATAIALLESQNLEDRTKAHLLGVKLIELVGPEVLAQAVASVKNQNK